MEVQVIEARELMELFNRGEGQQKSTLTPVTTRFPEGRDPVTTFRVEPTDQFAKVSIAATLTDIRSVRTIAVEHVGTHVNPNIGTFEALIERLDKPATGLRLVASF